MRLWEESSFSTETSRKGKTPTGLVGVLSVETRRTSSSVSKSRTGGTVASSTSARPSARKRRSASRCFLVSSLAARLDETSYQVLAVFPVLRGLLDVPDGYAALLAGALDGGEVDA